MRGAAVALFGAFGSLSVSFRSPLFEEGASLGRHGALWGKGVAAPGKDVAVSEEIVPSSRKRIAVSCKAAAVSCKRGAASCKGVAASCKPVAVSCKPENVPEVVAFQPFRAKGARGPLFSRATFSFCGSFFLFFVVLGAVPTTQ